MPYIRRSAIWPDPRIKPPVGAAYLDWSHPLARGLKGAWLINETGGNLVRDYARIYTGVLTNSGATRASLRGNVGFRNVGASNGQIRLGTITPQLGMSGNLSFSVFGRWLPIGSGANYRFFAWGANSTRNMMVLARPSDGNLGQFWFGDDQTAGTGENFSGKLVSVGCNYDTAANVRALYYQGRQLASAAPGGVPNFTDSAYSIGDFTNSAINADAAIDFVYLWQHRALTAAEMKWLHEEPFAMFKPIVSRKLLLPLFLTVDVFDGPTATDAFAIQLEGIGLDKSVFDTIVPTDLVQMNLPIQIHVSDTITPTESVTAYIPTSINVFDTITPTEAVTLSPAFIHQWNIQESFSESLLHVWDVVSDVSSELLLTHEWDIVEVVSSFTHAWRVLPSELQVLFDADIQIIFYEVSWATRQLNVADLLTPTESVTIAGLSHGLNVSDSLSPSEFVALRLNPSRLSVFDTATLAEFVRLVLPLKINVSSTLSPTDSFEISPLDVRISVTDTAAITDSVTVVRV